MEGQAVQFIVTGFGPFSGVDSNPTQCLVSWLQAQPAAAAAGGWAVASSSVLEVSARAVGEFLDQEQRELAAQACGGSGTTAAGPVVLLHLGVDSRSSCLRLEQQAFNDCTFRCPDEAGWQPDGVPIEPGLALGSTRCTQLPVHKLAHQLRQQGFDCQVSEDPGRYVCNYIYYRSLCLAAKQLQGGSIGGCTGVSAADPGGSGDGSEGGGSSSGPSPQRSQPSLRCYSLFVHVPSFDAIPEARQQAFLLRLLAAISGELRSGVGADCQQLTHQQLAAAAALVVAVTAAAAWAWRRRRLA